MPVSLWHRVLRLADYYALAERLGTSSLEGLLARLQVGGSPQGALGGTVDLGQPSPRAEPPEAIMERAASLEENAAEASDYWNTL